MSPKEIKERLKDRRLRVVAKETAVSYPTLKKLADGADVDYSTKTLKAVTAYLTKDHTVEEE